MTGEPPRGCVAAHLKALGTVIEVQVEGAGADVLIERIRYAWSRCVVPTEGEADVTIRLLYDEQLSADDPRRADTDLSASDLELLMHQLSPLVTTRAIDHQAGTLLMLHACGLADPTTGRTVALVAPSGTGKTTASATLGRRFGYVTDETLAVRADGTIAAYPKPLSVIVDGSHWKNQVSVDEIGLLSAPDDCSLAGVAILCRDGAEEAWAEEIPVVRALALLGPESSYLARLDRPLHRLAEAVSGAGGLRVLHYADRQQLAPLVDDLLKAPA